MTATSWSTSPSSSDSNTLVCIQKVTEVVKIFVLKVSVDEFKPRHEVNFRASLAQTYDTDVNNIKLHISAMSSQRRRRLLTADATRVDADVLYFATTRAVPSDKLITAGLGTAMNGVEISVADSSIVGPRPTIPMSTPAATPAATQAATPAAPPSATPSATPAATPAAVPTAGDRIQQSTFYA